MPTKTIHKTGTVQSFNVSPKGSYEGLLLKENGRTVQVNFSPDLADNIRSAAAVGETIEFEVEPVETRGEHSHPVYRLMSFKNGNRNGDFSGKVLRLNYALHGEVNGGILDTGDFLHLKPHGAAALELAVGMEVKGTGVSKPMVGGHRVIEAEEVNGVHLEHKPKPKKKAAHH